MQNYLTQLLGLSAYEPDGKRVARVHDIAALQGDRLPIVSAVFLRAGKRDGWLAIEDLEVRANGVWLLKPWSELTPYKPGGRDVRLQRDVLDQQIVDVQDYRVVRVNDVRFAMCGGQACVVGIDASLRAMIRRLGLGAPVEAIAKAVGRPLQSQVIGWDDVERLEPGAAGGGRIKLKVPHERIARLHPADIADIVEQLDPKQRVEVIDSLDVGTAADTIEEMEEEEAAAVMETLTEEKAADILDEMEPDAAADVLGELTDARTEELLEHMEPDEAADVKELLGYAEETAGGVMTTEYVAISREMTCEATIARLRELAPKAETAYYLYIVDPDERLVGVLSLRDLIVAQPETIVGNLMETEVRRVQVTDHISEIARTVSKYNLLALPVVDEDDCLSGIVTVDDMMEWLMPPERRRRTPAVAIPDDN